MRCLPFCSGCDKPSPGRDPGAIPGQFYSPARQRNLGAEALRRDGSPQPPLCKGGTAWQSHAGGIVKPGNSNRLSFNCLARQRRGGPAAIPLFAFAGCIRLGKESTTAQALGPSGHRTGSTGCQRRYSANPSVGVRRQLPLHKGAVFAAQHTTGSSATVCQDCKAAPTGEAGAPGPSNAYSRGEYGSGGSPPWRLATAPLVQRGDRPPQADRGD